MQSAIGEEYKTKYESAINAQKEKIKLLQAKSAQMHKKHEAELKDAEKKGASVAMAKMAKAMKQVCVVPSFLPLRSWCESARAALVRPRSNSRKRLKRNGRRHNSSTRKNCGELKQWLSRKAAQSPKPKKRPFKRVGCFPRCPYLTIYHCSKA